jgi:1,4-dihydroxy-2-naphthoate polyprenyltransferase
MAGGLAPWLGVARAPFLLLPLTLVAVGAAAAAQEGPVSWGRTLLALLGLVAVHAAVNALNEASDFRTGIDLRTRRTPFSGGSGTLPSRVLGEKAARAFGWALAGVGLACGVALLPVGGVILAVMMAVGASFVLGYTDLLARAGLGEIAAGLGLGALPVLGAALVQQGGIGPAAWAASVPAFFMTFNLLLLNEFPDEAADRSGGRRNLLLLLGRRAAARLYVIAGVLTPASIGLAVDIGALPRIALIALAPSLILILPIRWALTDPEQDPEVSALGANVIWNLATNSVLAAALILAALRG